jgi:pyruvate-formate lyase-activating enzyme
MVRNGYRKILKRVRYPDGGPDMNIHRITHNPKSGSCSLYFIGCNFRCLACYWKQIYGKVNLRKVRLLDLDEVIDRLKPISPRSVSILSGDAKPNESFDRLPKALKDAFGCEVRLITNGYILPELEGLTHVAMSIKALNPDLHKRYTGKSNRQCLRHLKEIHEAGIGLSASSVYIPGLIEADEIERIARFVASVDETIPYRVIGYMKVDGMDIREPSYEEVAKVAARAARYLKTVVFSRSSGEDYSGIVDLFTNDLRR